MNAVKSVLTVMIVALAVVGCNSNSGGNGGGNGVYPQPTVIGPYDQGQYPPGQYPGGQPGNPYPNQGGIQPGNYDASIRCDNEAVNERSQEMDISFSLKRNGTYTQEIVNVDYRCRQNCLMIGEGSYAVNAGGITLNQTRLLNEYGGLLQGPRSNTLQLETIAQTPNPKSKKSSSVIVLRDGGTDNVCGGPFRMYLKKQTNHSRR